MKTEQTAPYDYHHLEHVKKQTKSGKTLWFALIVTILFTALEIAGGILSNSLALLSDSAHMISDVVALGLSMAAIYLARRAPNSRYTFGYLRFEIIASFLNGLLLCVIAVGIFIEGIRRFIRPEPIDFGLMLAIAAVGLIVNIALTWALSRSNKEEENLNIKSALWHFIGDLLSSIGVIVSAALIYWTGKTFFDPLVSLLIGGIIFTGGAKILRESTRVLMESVPAKFNLEEIRKDLMAVEGVIDVHDMHLWAISTDHYSLTAHMFVREDVQPFCVTLAANEILKTKYGIEHSTLQMEHASIHPHGEYGRKFQKRLMMGRTEHSGTCC